MGLDFKRKKTYSNLKKVRYDYELEKVAMKRAAEIATETVKEFLDKDDRINKVIFNVFKDEDLEIYRSLL